MNPKLTEEIYIILKAVEWVDLLGNDAAKRVEESFDRFNKKNSNVSSQISIEEGNSDERMGIGISNLSKEQLKQLCSKMATLMVFKNTESSFDNLFDIFDFDLSEYKGLDYYTEPESDIYTELEDILTRLLGQTFLIKAIKKPDEFLEIDSQILKDFLLLSESIREEEVDEWLRDCCDNYF